LDTRNDHPNAFETTSNFEPPALRPDLALLEAHFASPQGRSPASIRNYHREQPVPERVRKNATPAAVLIPLVERDDALNVLVTRRHHEISYPGHVCYPGGRSDPGDAGPTATALREAHEEINLDPAQVRVLGRLGLYYTQSGYCVTPIVGVVRPPLSLQCAPREVSEVHELPFSALTHAGNYRIWRTDPVRQEAFFAFEHEGVRITGPTVCMTMGFYEALAVTHAKPPPAIERHPTPVFSALGS
jgi:8-oxo-dGTP pyrophosphatase MutT (NUDIX family)